MGEWRGLLAFAVMLVVVLAAGSWLIRETPELLSSSASDSQDNGPADTQSSPADPAAGDTANGAGAQAQAPRPEDALDAAAIEAALELASQQEQVSISPEQACEGLGGTWRSDSRGWCDLPLPSASPVSDTAVLHAGMQVPCPQPLAEILQQVIEGAIGGDEMRIYLLYRSVDDDLEEIDIDTETGNDIRLIADGLRRVEADMRNRAASQRSDLTVDSFLPMQQRPATGEIGAGYGMRVHPVTGYWSMHNGVDITGDTGDPVTAVLGGEVLSAQYCPFYGNTVVVYHGAGLASVYAHLDSLAVRPADEVSAGQLLGPMGATGRATGPHLHFETRVDGASVNPEPFMPADDDASTVAAGEPA